MGLFFRDKKKATKSEKEFEKAYQQWKQQYNELANKEKDKLLITNKSWVWPYQTEVDRSISILQRRRRLMEMPRFKDETPPDSLDGNPPGYEDLCVGLKEAQRLREINELTEWFWASNTVLQRMENDKPSTWNVKKIDILRQHVDQNGHPYSWVGARGQCAATGGCCGRTCECCEKALFTYFKYVGYERQKMETKVYGHCTEECACCAQVRHRYHPNPLLPKSSLLSRYPIQPELD